MFRPFVGHRIYMPPHPILGTRHARRAVPFCRAMECPMLDVVYLAGGCLFFAAAVAYSVACDRL